MHLRLLEVDLKRSLGLENRVEIEGDFFMIYLKDLDLAFTCMYSENDEASLVLFYPSRYVKDRSWHATLPIEANCIRQGTLLRELMSLLEPYIDAEITSIILVAYSENLFREFERKNLLIALMFIPTVVGASLHYLAELIGLNVELAYNNNHLSNGMISSDLSWNKYRNVTYTLLGRVNMPRIGEEMRTILKRYASVNICSIGREERTVVFHDRHSKTFEHYVRLKDKARTSGRTCLGVDILLIDPHCILFDAGGDVSLVVTGEEAVELADEIIQIVQDDPTFKLYLLEDLYSR